MKRKHQKMPACSSPKSSATSGYHLYFIQTWRVFRSDPVYLGNYAYSYPLDWQISRRVCALCGDATEWEEA